MRRAPLPARGNGTVEFNCAELACVRTGSVGLLVDANGVDGRTGLLRARSSAIKSARSSVGFGVENGHFTCRIASMRSIVIQDLYHLKGAWFTAVFPGQESTYHVRRYKTLDPVRSAY